MESDSKQNPFPTPPPPPPPPSPVEDVIAFLKEVQAKWSAGLFRGRDRIPGRAEREELPSHLSLRARLADSRFSNS